MAEKILLGYVAGRELKALIDVLAVTTDQKAELINKATELAKEAGSVKPAGKDNAAANSSSTDLSAALCTLPALSLISPRGKYNLSIFPESLVFTSDKGEFSVPCTSIQAVAILDNIPNDTKGKVLMFISLVRGAGVTVGKTTYDNIVLQTTADAELTVELKEGEALSGAAAIVLCQALGMAGVSDFLSPDPDNYSSAKGHVGVGAVHKVNHGFLFPMPSALCFVERPALYFPHQAIRWAELARAGGASSTFDLLLHTQGGGRTEFCQIDRSELGALQGYLQRSRIKMSAEEAAAAEAKAAAKGQGMSGAGSGACGEEDDEEEEDDSEDEEDSDFDPDQGGHGGSGRGDKRPAKRARTEGAGGAGGSTSAAAAGGDEEEDIGESEEDEDEDEYESDEEEEDDSEVEYEDEDDISAAAVTKLMSRDKAGSTKKRARAAGPKGGDVSEDHDEGGDEEAEEDD